MPETPLVEFFQLIVAGRRPKRAERSAGGTLPSRALRYCDAVTSATSYGYWLFPPMTFHLLWDGAQIFWSLDDGEEWLPISGTAASAVQFPDFSDEFDKEAPDGLKGYSPPFLSALVEPGVVQIWSGLLAKTRPGWSLNVRAPVNVPLAPNIVASEGIIETDLWFGPLFNNFRLTKTDTPVILRAEVPFLQVQPVPQFCYSDDTLGDWACHSASDIAPADWARFSDVVVPDPDTEARKGHYAVSVRKRRLCPVAPQTSK